MNSKKLLFIILLLVGCSGAIASDIYSPSLPAIASGLQTSLAHVQFTMAIYMFGLAISQLFYGPWSEGVGRKIPIITGLFIMLAGNFICLFASSISVLIAGRLIQGLGAGACAALWRSSFRDTFEGSELAKYGAYFSILVIFIVPAAPALGGYLQEHFNWRASFAFLVLYCAVTIFMVITRFVETSVNHHRDKLKVKFALDSYKQILSSPVFLGYTACTFLCYGAFFSWFSVGPVLLIHIVGITPIEFGYITLFGGGIATALGGIVNGNLVTRFGTHTMLRIGFASMLIAGLLMLSLKFIFGINTFVIVMPMIIFYFGVTFIWPSAFAGAFGPFGEMAGYAGALYGFMQISGAAVIGSLVSYLPHNNQTSLALIFIVSAILASIVFEKIVRKKEEVT